MNKPSDPTFSRTIRLPGSKWEKLRDLMQLQGRKWLEDAISNEHAKFKWTTKRKTK